MTRSQHHDSRRRSRRERRIQRFVGRSEMEFRKSAEMTGSMPILFYCPQLYYQE
ncbi:MAG: hypothetical protein JJV92_05470 [Desulfosarcina sp.]|nr:hypothetical protein [Desulfobacterales bacterium]